MYDTHTPAEWLAMTSLSTGIFAAASVPYFLLVDAELADFDPRPAMRRAVESGRFDALLVAVANAKHDAHAFAAAAQHLPRDAALWLAALLLILTLSPEATR